MNNPGRVLSARRLRLKNKVGEISTIAREVSDLTKAGLRVPPTVWEKYDRFNKRHKKEQGVVTVAAKTRNTKTTCGWDDAPAAEHFDCSKQREEHPSNSCARVKLDRHGQSQLLFKGRARGSDDHRAGSRGNLLAPSAVAAATQT